MADNEQNIPSEGATPGPEGTAGGAAADGQDGDPPVERSTARKLLRFVLIALGSIVGGVIILLLLFVLALQTNWGGTHFADFLVTLANPFGQAQTDYEELNGNFITRLEFEDLWMYRLDTVYVDTLEGDPPVIRRVPKDSLRSPEEAATFDTLLVDTLSLATIDTFRIRYNLLSLLRRAVHFNEIYFANPSFTARQQPDSSWDLLEPFVRDTVEAGEAAFTFEIDDFDVTDGSLVAVYYPPSSDSVFQVENFNVHGGDVEIADLISARVDTLYGRYSPPGQEYFTDLRASGVLLENDLNLAGLVLESPQSHVTAAGRLSLPGEEDDIVENIDFNLNADPIAFSDLHPFVPSLNANRSATLDVHVGGSSKLLDIDASGDLSDGGAFSLVGSLSPTTDGPVQYTAEGRLRSFDPTFFTGEGDRQTVLNAQIDLDLAGTDLQQLDGTAAADLSASSIAGVELAAGAFDARFDDGRADAELSTTWNGSTVTAEGTLRPFDEIPTYSLRGRTTNFDLASLGLEDQQSDIDAAFTVEGSGLNPDVAEVEGNIALAPSTVNDYPINDGTVDFELAGGELNYGFRFLFPDGLLAANGVAQLEDPLRFTMQRGRFENVDLAALLGQEPESSLNGTFRAEGVGTDPQSMEVEAVLSMEPSTYGTYQLQDGTIGLNLSDGLLRMTAVADMAEAGNFDFALVTRPFDEMPTFNVTRGEFANVDIGALLDMPDQESDLTGTASFTATGFDPQTMRLEGEISLSDSRLNEQQITSAVADLNLRQGLLSFDASVDVPEGSADLAGSMRPFRDPPTYEVTRGEFQNINLAALTGNPSLESSLDGTLSITGTGFDPETLNLQGRIDFAGSRLNEQQIDAASVVGTFQDGVFDVELSLSVPEGDTRITGTIQPFLETPTYTIREGTFAGINIAALTGEPDWQTNLAGRVSLTGTGFDAETMSVDGSVQFDQSTVNEATLSGGTISGNLIDGFARFDANLDFVEGAAQFEGTGSFFQEVPTYQVQGTVSNVDVADIVGNDTLQAVVSAAFDLEGAGLDPATMRLEGLVTSSDAVYEGADVDTLYSQFLLNDGVLAVDSLFLRSTAADLQGSGIIALYDTTTASDFRFTADIDDLTPFRSLLAAQNLQLEEGFLDGRVYGRPGTLRFDVQGTLRGFIYDDIRISEFEGTIAGEFGPDRELTIAEIQGDFAAVALPQFLIQEADVDLTYTAAGIQFDGVVTIGEGRVAEIAGFVDTAPDAQRILIEQLDLELDGQEWQLLQEATISYGEEYRIRNLLLYSDDQQLAVDGVVDPNGEQNLVMTIEQFDVGPFADLLGYEGLGAIVDGTLLLTGPAESPDMTGTLNADVESYDQDVGDLRLALDYTDLRLNIDALITHEDGSDLEAIGYIPLDLRVSQLSEGGVEGGVIDQSVDFTIVADSFAVGWIEPFLNPDAVSEFNGRLTANADVSGTIDAPVVDGQARYVDGRIGLPELGLTYEGIEANFVLDQNEVAVNNFIIRSGDGWIRGDGTILLPELTLGEFNVDLQASDFLAIDTRPYEFIIDGDMVLSGTTQLPELRGDVEVTSGEVLLTEEVTGPELEQVELSNEALQTVERRFGIHITESDTTTFSLYNALAMELDVSIERNTWIRSQVNPVLDIQFSGDLDLIKEHYADVNVYGTIEVVPQRSQLVQFGKRFDITSGTLTFSGPAADPLIDIDAEYQPRTFRGGAEDSDVTITLALEGRMSEQLDLALGSDAGLDNTDILSYLATGRPAGESLQLGGVGADLAFNELATIVEGIAQAGLGLDVVTIDQQGGTTHLTAGTYVSSRLFVSVSQPFGDATGPRTDTGSESTPVITVEYEVANWLLLRLLQQGQTLHLNLQWEYAY